MSKNLGGELDEIRHLSLEFLIAHLHQKAPKELLLLLLEKAPLNPEALIGALEKNDLLAASELLKIGKDRSPLPTAPYYGQIIDAFLKEDDQTLATNLLRYLLFFPMKKAHETAIPYLIEQYAGASTDEKLRMISPYCWSATTIHLDG